ncbi:MAG TPA: VCBS repeat-containing protein, partial [Puia sp.]
MKFWFFSFVFLVSCTSGYRKNKAHADVSDESIKRGEAVAAKYCGSCHRLPAPDLLDVGSWERGVLPQMGPRLGVFQFRGQKYPSSSGDPNVGRQWYPEKALVSQEDWSAVIDYYTALAPDSMPGQKREESLVRDTGSFGLVSAVGGGAPPATCFVKYEPGLKEIVTSDIMTHTLDVWGFPGKKDSFLIGGSIVDWARDSAGYLVCNIGPFGPNNAPAGHVDRLSVPMHVAASGRPLPVVYDSLLRPVALATADLNGDGRKDMVVSEFGYIKGELVWLENMAGGKYEKHVLRNIAGAIRVEIEDYNHDGLPDIWALFAQGDEGIFRYTNQGKGQFKEEVLLRFPPSYGSAYFELADFNGDGAPDLVYAAGDNGDFSTVLKPYHGVYIFLNDGQGHFDEGRKYFFPINGCFRAMARDFDGDGDLDIACIAYFADFKHQPEEGFVYLENKGGGTPGGGVPGGGASDGGAQRGMKFTPHSVPGTEVGRWITMDVAD